MSCNDQISACDKGSPAHRLNEQQFSGFELTLLLWPLLRRHASLLILMAKYHDTSCKDGEEILVMIPRLCL